MNVGSPKRAQFEQSKQNETEESSNTMEELELQVMQTNDHTDNMVVKVTKFTSETKEKSVNSMIHGQEKSLTSSPIVSDLHTLGKDQEYDKMHAVEKEASTAANQISKEKVEDAAQSTHDNTKIGCQMQTTDKNLQKEKVILPQRVNKHKKLPFRKDRLKEKQEKCQEMHDFNKTYKYKCMTNNCGKLFGTITQLTHHKAEAHVEKLARQCLECGRTFSSSNVYKSHLRMRHNQLGAVQFGYKNVELLVKAGSNSLDAASVWNCVMCGCMLNGREEYADHATDCSPLQLRFYCPYCTESCGTFEQIQTHKGAVHPEEQMTVSPSQKYQGLKSTETEPALQVTEGETVCRACHMEFSSSILLKQHMNEKHATYPYCCGVCHLSYGRQSALKRHLLAHKPQLTCSFCGKVFIDKAILEHHINTHTGDRPFQCDVCGSRYCSDKSVKKHMMLQHFDIYKERYQSTRAVQGILSSSNSLRGEAVCHICGLTCQDHLKLQEHLQQHEGHMKCDSCSKSFSSNRALAQHQKSHILDSMKSNKQQTIVEFGNPDQPSRNKLFQDMRIVDQNPHPSGKRLKCSLCGKRFKRTNALNQHIQAMHMTDNDKKCICKICNRGFYRKALLISHMRVHTNHRPYRCRLCNKTYKQLGHIRDHLRFHGKSQYGCKMCGCQFKTKATLGTHVLTHCTIFPFKCPFQKCKQAFRDVPSLLCHCLNETSDDTFLVCNNCEKSFMNKADYTSHMQNHSSDEVFPCTMCGTTFTTYKRLYFHKAEKGHIESCEVNLTQKHFRKIKNNSVNEVNEDVDLDFLLSQYDFIDPNGKVVEKQYSGTDCNVSDEEGEEDNFTKEADDANELILIAEQLTHMAAGTEQLKEFVVPETSVTSLPELVQIVASTADTTSDHSDLYKTNTVGENLGYPAVIVRSEMQDKQDGLTYDEEFVEEASNEVTMSTFGFVLKENQANHNIDDSSENKDTETLDYTICEEVSSLETFTDATVAVDGMETAGEILCQTDEPNADMIEQVDTADMEQDLSFVSTDITPTVKVVDQLGNELIVCVVNEKGEQEKMPDGQDVIRTVLNTGKYEIEKQYQEISAKPGLLDEIGEINLQSDSLVVTDVYVIKEKDPTNDYSDSRNIVTTGSMKKKKAKLTTVSENTDKILGRLDADLTPESNVKVHLNYYRDKSDSDLYPYQCQSCSLRFDCIKNLNHHKKTHLSLAERKYRCSLCPAAFNIPSALDVHMRVHSGEKPYSCSKCDKKFRQRGHLLTHLRGHEGYCPFHCNLCDKKFVANNLLTKHMKLKHSIKESLSKGTISCDICGQMFSNKKEFRSHQLAHLDGKTRKRLVKKYNASTASMVAVKEKEHAQDMLGEVVEEEPEIVMKDVKRETFICDICGQMFSHLQTLKAHQLRHATGSNCVCTECGKKFANEFLLKKHLKSHQSGVSQCDVCGKQVKYPFSLRRHMKLHDVVKQNKYHCPKCNMGYMLEPSFLRHIAGCMEEEIFVQEGNTGL